MKWLKWLSSSDSFILYVTYAYFVLFVIFLLPSFQIGPLYTHTIGKLAIILLFVLWSTVQYILNRPLIPPQLKPLAYVSLFYFISQSVSVFAVQDFPLFIDRYTDLIAVFLYFFLSLNVFARSKQSHTLFIWVILFGTGIVTLIKTGLFLRPSDTVQWLSSFLHPGYIEIIEFNLGRGRIYLESYEEITIPILIYLLTQRDKPKLPLLFFIIIIQFFTFASNFRTKILMSLVAYAGSFFISVKKIWTHIAILATVIAISYGSLIFLKYTMGANIIDRVLMTSQYEDVSTINVRLEQAKQALEVARISPFFGIGLGQYILYTNDSPSLSLFVRGDQGQNLIREAQIPHNIFFHTLAESGIIGLAAIVVLHIYFVLHDLNAFRSKNQCSKFIIVSFWTLMIYSLFNPTYNFSYILLFWTLRSLIESERMANNIAS